MTDFDAAAARRDFPALNQKINGKPIAYLDSAASAQKPIHVITAMDAAVFEGYANVHRGLYRFANQTTEAFEAARKTVQRFLNAGDNYDVVWTRNSTEAINLVASSWGDENIKAGDEIILSALEHHANIVPWVRLAQKNGAVIKVIPLTPLHDLDYDAYTALLSPRTKLIAISHLSNALGIAIDMPKIINAAKTVGAKVLVDGSQSAVHQKIDVQSLGADFFVFTGHKTYGPTGIGVLCARADILNEMPPYQGGGEMIETVSFDKITYKSSPQRFEAGTPPIIEAIGLAAALDYMGDFERDAVDRHEKKLVTELQNALLEMGGVTIYAPQINDKILLSFNIDKVHPHDAASVFDQMAVAVRAGHHCCQPLMKSLGVSATLRASVGLYSTANDIDALIAAVHKAKALLQR
jgi:cysteine desulfurase/selenocysteine lyase